MEIKIQVIRRITNVVTIYIYIYILYILCKYILLEYI